MTYSECMIALSISGVLGLVLGRILGRFVGSKIGARFTLAAFGSLAGFVLLSSTVVLSCSGLHPLDGPLLGLLIAGLVVVGIGETVVLALQVGEWRTWGNVVIHSNAKPVSQPFNFTVREFAVSVLLICLTLGTLRWSAERLIITRRTTAKICSAVDSLAAHCPSAVDQDEWNHALSLTRARVLKSSALPSEIRDLDDFVLFAGELDDRTASGKIDPETIQWIWDEVEKLSKSNVNAECRPDSF